MIVLFCCLHFLAARAEAMQAAADANPSGMVSVLGLTLTSEKVAELCAEASKNTKETGLLRKQCQLVF